MLLKHTLLLLLALLVQIPQIQAEGINTYKVNENGTTVRVYEHFAGELDEAKCVAYCGCKSYGFAGIDGEYCWCGNDTGVECGSSDCITKKDSSGVSTGFNQLPPSKVELWNDISVDILPVSGATKYGVVINGKVTEFNGTYGNIVNITLAERNNSIIVEPEAFWGCQSEPYVVETYINATMSVECQKNVLFGEELECFAAVTGTDLTSLKWFNDNVEVTDIPYPAEPYYYSVGGNMETNRFEDYWESYDWEENVNTAYINPNHEFRADGRIKAFEAYITRMDGNQSCVKFMVLKPICLADKKYCVLEKKCMEPKTACGDDPDDLTSIFDLNTRPVYLMSSGRFAVSKSFVAPELTEVTVVIADYEVMYVFEGMATHIGTNVFVVPDKDGFDVKPGYVLGWLPCAEYPADIGYYPIDPVYEDLFPEYEYPEIFKTYKDAVFDQTVDYFKISNYMHMLRAYVLSPTVYMETFLASGEPGDILDIKAELVSPYIVGPLTKTGQGIVTEEIGNLTISGVEELNAGVDASFTFLMTNGSGAIYCINWGDAFGANSDKECSIEVTNSTVKYSWGIPGVYTIYVRAYNEFSQENTTKIINVRGGINSVDFTNQFEHIPPVPTNELLMVDFAASGSGNVDIMVDYIQKNGTTESTTEFNSTLSKYFIGHAEKAFSESQDILCNITVSHPLQSLSVSDYGSVEDPVGVFELVTNDTGATYNLTTFRIYDHIGTNVSYYWVWGDSETDNYTYIREANHTYYKYGNYTINITAYNKVSTRTLSFVYTIQDTIQGLHFLGISHYYTEHDKNATIIYMLQNGTGVRTWIDYSDSVSSPIAYDIDIETNDSFMIGHANYIYLNRGTYNVTVYCENAISNLSISYEMPVENRISEFQTNLTQEKIGGMTNINGHPVYDFIEVNETLTLYASFVLGGEVTFNYDVGDGRNITTTSERSITFKYPDWSENGAFTINVSATNVIETIYIVNVTFVDMPIQELLGFEILHQPENSTEKMNMTLSIESGDYFNCTWDLGNNGLIKFIDYNNYLENYGAVLNQYDASSDPLIPGYYNVSVNCSSRLYYANATTLVSSYNPVSEFIVDLHYECDGKNRSSKGAGDREDLFPVNCMIVFVVSEQTGTNVSYGFNFGYMDASETLAETTTYNNSETYHLFTFARKATQDIFPMTVSINASNVVSWFQEVTVVQLITGIDNITIQGDGKDTRVDQFANISVKISNKAYRACYVIDFGSPREKSIVFGDDSCPNDDRFQFFEFVGGVNLIPGKFVKVIGLKYGFENLYTVTLRGYNPLSEVMATTTIKVVDYPCNPPTIEWQSAMATEEQQAKNQAPFYKCLQYSVLTKAIPDCEKPNATIRRTWSLIHKSSADGRPIEKPISGMPGYEDSRFLITERLLEYGTYFIKFNVSMYHNESGLYIPETESIITGYFYIKKCDLVPQILGGTGRAVGHEGYLTLDGSKSHDPDIEPGLPMGLTYKWFCKRNNKNNDPVVPLEEFKLELDDSASIIYPTEPAEATKNDSMNRDTFVGCFGNGIGRLAEFNDDADEIEIDKKFMLYSQSYNIRFAISKEGRTEQMIDFDLTILLKEPPIVSIVCNLNCRKQVNVLDKTSFVATCDNCAGRTPYYRWELYQKKITGGDFKNITLNLTNFATTDISSEKNLVIQPDSFKQGYEYKVKLFSAWEPKEKFDKNKIGFSQYTIEVNKAPDVSLTTCKIRDGAGKEINKGTALDTEIKIECIDVSDEDIPLSFQWYYLRERNVSEEILNTEWKTAAMPTSGTAVGDKSQSTSGGFYLPPGKKEMNRVIRLRVTVADVFGATSDPFYVGDISVEPKVMAQSDIENLLSSPNVLNDPGLLNNVVTSMLDSLDDLKSQKDSDVDPFQVLNMLIEMVSNVKINSAWACLVTSQMLDSISKQHFDLGQKDTDDATAVRQQLSTLSIIAQCSNEVSVKELERTAYHAIRASIRFTSNLVGNDSVKQLKKAMRDELLISTTAASNMISGEPPLEIVYSGGYVKLSCVDPRVAKEKGVDMGGFQLPEDINDDGKKECIGVINTKGPNRHTNDITSGSVHGPVYGMTLSPERDVIKSVKNLTTPIRLAMPIPEEDIVPVPENHTAYCELMKEVHLIDCKVNSTALIIKTIPHNKSFDGNIFVFINKGLYPSIVEHDINCTLPNPYPSNWSSLTAELQDHFEKEEKWRCFVTEDQMDRKCVGTWSVGVVYYTNSTNRTGLIKQKDYPVSEAPCGPMHYSYTSYSRACLFYEDEEESETWSGIGCQTSKETNDLETVCYCNHLTDFGGGGPFPDPNPIDFSAAFAGFSTLGDNPTVFSVVMVILGLYLIGLLIARRKDKSDAQKRMIWPLEENHPSDNYYYEVSVQTGSDPLAATTADVFFILKGSENELAPKKLYNPNRKCFNKGEIDYFLVAAPRSVGRLESVEIWHNNTGDSPGWFLMQIQVRDVQRDRTSIFVCNNWLDVAEDDGQIIRDVPLAAKEDLVEFEYVFVNTIRRNMYDGHIWLSVFTKHAQSTYTHVQRLSTCLSLLLTFMLCNAMFYNVDNLPPPAEVYRIGPLKISIDQVRIGFATAVMCIPIHLLIVLLFKTASPKPNKNATKYEPEEIMVDSPKDAEKGVAVPIEPENDEAANEEEAAIRRHNSVIRFLRFILFSGRTENDRSKPLPYWVLYIAYVLVFLTTMASAFLVMLYGFTFGKDISEKWIVTLLVSLFESIFLFQPIKVLFLSILFAVFMKEPEKNLKDIEDYVSDGIIRKTDGDENEEDMEKKMEFRLPNEKRQEEARQKRMKEKVLKAMVKEIIVHLAYVLLASVVCFAAVDSNSYRLYEGAQKLMLENGVTSAYFNNEAYMLEDLEPDLTKRQVKKAKEVTNRLEWFDWARYSVIEYLFPIGWYNDDKNYKPGFVADNEASKILAMARFRMLRVQNRYSPAVEDTANYNTGWKPVNPNATARAIEQKAFRKNKREAMYMGLESPWIHQTSAELNNFPLVAQFATYSGDSYSVSIGPTKKVAKTIVKSMKDNFWVDRFTRAIVLEANIYNANTQLMLIVTFAHEILATGGWEYFSNLKALRLNRYVGDLADVIMLFDFIFIFVTCVGLYKMIRGFKRNGCGKYLGDFWNLTHTVVTCSALGAIIIGIGRIFAVKTAVYTYSQEPEKFVSFGMVEQMDNFSMAFLGFVLFFTNLEYLRVLRFNKSIANMTKTMKLLGSPIMSFGMTFIIIFMAYVSFCHCIFADKLFAFHSIKSSFVALTNMFMGSFDIYAYLDNAPVFGPIMFFSYMLSIQMIMINMFIGIICDAFAEVGAQEDNEDKPSVISFMANRVKSLTAPKGALDSSGVAPLYSDWKDEWDVMMEDFDERADNCIYLMRNMEGEEIRQIKWFDPNEADLRKKNTLTAVLGTDFYQYDSEFCDGLGALEKKMKTMSPAETAVFLKAAAIKRKEDKAELERMENENEMSDESDDDDDDDDEM